MKKMGEEKEGEQKKRREGGRETGGSRWKVCVAGAGCRGSH